MSQGGDHPEGLPVQARPGAHSIQMDFKAAAREQGVTFVNAAPWFCYG